MWFRRKQRNLKNEHRPEKIRKRISRKKGESVLGDAVLGGVDGIVTTFAVIAGSAGGKLSSQVVIILGLANLIADGFSMAVSNYLSTKSEGEQVERAREDESRQIEEYPKGERREVREIFARKGFDDATLNYIVEVITSNRDVWVDTMLSDELKMRIVSESPRHAAVTTFVAFVFFGFVPLIPYIFSFPQTLLFPVSSCLAAFAFISLGVWKGVALHRSPIRSGVQTFVVGGIAAVLAYGVGALLHSLFGMSPGQGG
ncbi:MAG: VIT1/CCC1 transporter family protein [Candidatus Latescibacterota bacterium]